MSDLLIIVRTQFPGGWEELAKFIKGNIPLYQCKYYGKYGLFGSDCGYSATEAGCRDNHSAVSNAIGLVKHTFGISSEEAESIVNALSDIGWVKIWKCGRIIFNV